MAFLAEEGSHAKARRRQLFEQEETERAEKTRAHDLLSLFSLFPPVNYRANRYCLRSCFLRPRAFARVTIGIDELAKLGQLVGRELAGFYEVDSEAAGGAVEDAVDEFADHRAGGGVLSDGGGPLVAAAGRLAFHEALLDHDAKHRGN